MMLIPIGCAEDSKPIGYVVEIHGDGKWYGPRKAEIVPLTPLSLDDELTMVPKHGGSTPTIKMRFFPALCDDDIKCGPTEPCTNIVIRQRYEKLGAKCRAEEGTWMSALANAWKDFFGPHVEGTALAMTLSRGTDDSDDDPSVPPLHEAVLRVENGRVDLKPLFRTALTDDYSLQFCDPGPNLALDATSEQCSEKGRAKLTGTKIAISLEGGAYLVRLWKRTPKGEQPTGRTAISLVCSNCEQTQKEFEGISDQALESAGSNRIIRSMLGAWLADQARKGLK
jgi:hypothetical protein